MAIVRDVPSRRRNRLAALLGYAAAAAVSVCAWIALATLMA